MREVVDPEGRAVVLTDAHWAHVLLRHPYIDVEPDELLFAVAEPDAHMPGRKPGEEWFYRHGLGPSAWIRVVVHYDGDRGLIVTAFPRRLFP